jgi:hypothetical protein
MAAKRLPTIRTRSCCWRTATASDREIAAPRWLQRAVDADGDSATSRTEHTLHHSARRRLVVA